MKGSILAENIKAYRKSRGLTQETLADKVGTTRQCIGSYEEGRAYPPLYIFYELATLFEVSMEYLLTNEEPIHTNEVADADEVDVIIYGNLELMQNLLNDTARRLKYGTLS